MTKPTAADVPVSQGYAMPAEWEPHESTWIAWPHNKEDWPGKFSPIPWVYTEIIRILARGERVNIFIKGLKRIGRALDKLDSAGVEVARLRLIPARTNRVWTRDTGPTFLVNPGAAEPGERRALLDWKFNGWAKYDDHEHDDRLPRRVQDVLDLRTWEPRVEVEGSRKRVVMEGGAIDVNGRGTLLTTEECLLSEVQQRNPFLDRAGYERLFADYLGIRHVIWLGQGIDGDDTHGHVDDLARFVGPSTVVTVVEPRASDVNHERLEDNHRRLREARDQDGQPLTIVTLPMPAPVVFEGQRLPASYANFYIANGVVLVPTFNDPNDRVALNTLADLFPDRQVIGIHSLDLVLGLGTLHCLSQQEPAIPGGSG
ncbi:MAG: agmatine deiminase family protein [Isosphaeraceae bacterium]